MLEIKNISLSFDKELIKNGQLYIYDNQITVLSGPSGSGKSSLLYDIALLSHQSQMNYIFDGKDIQTLSKDEIRDIQRNKIAFVFQNIPLFNSMNLMENIRFYASLTQETFSEEKARQYLTDLELFLDDHTDIEYLSGGERQRLAIICALMKDTPYIFMDEPTAYLDEDNREEFIKILDLLKNRYHKTILIASHDSLLFEVCDNLYEVKDKQIQCIKNSDLVNAHPSLQHKDKYVFKGLPYFYKCEFRKNQWKHKTFQLFLTFILFISTFCGMYLQYYQKQLDKNVEEYRSSQLVIRMDKKISGPVLREMEELPNIKAVKRITPLMSDNQYLICPYLENDFFTRGIKQSLKNENHAGVYINYETYRDTKDKAIDVIVEGKNITLQPDYQLDKAFADYKLKSNLARVIYLPYEEYLKLYNYKDNSPIQSSYALISLDDANEYLETLEVLIDKYEDISLENQIEITTLLNIKNTTEQFTNSIMIFICAIVVLSIILLKIIDYYHLRFSQVLLEVNGISNKDIRKQYIIKELSQYGIPIIIAYIALLISYGFLKMLNIQMMIYLFMILIACAFVIFVLSIIIYIIMNKFLSTTKILKMI
ncbi:MAG: ATP-binding cassette domain-containing protein [Coprobacillus cateniformis]|uniref:ATP-binding cassette domain-containing protein n=1 Tax=Longibaculum muris TaxID=1796628 RepID=UPI003AB6D8B1|nr:ATP-binding cassette domain-containing protein [Coprobacillus cateniformis]